MISLGLTGKVGAGKSTVLTMLSAIDGVQIHDSDTTVHDLYLSARAGAVRVASIFPDTLDDNGDVDRAALRAVVFSDPDKLRRLEALIHPLLERARREFLFSARCSGAQIAAIEFPLLFETSAMSEFDAIAVVTAPEAMRRQRVLARPGVDDTAFAAISEAQESDSCHRADFVIDTGRDMADTRVQAEFLVKALTQ